MVLEGAAEDRQLPVGSEASEGLLRFHHSGAAQRKAISALSQRWTLPLTSRIDPSAFSMMLVQACERRSSARHPRTRNFVSRQSNLFGFFFRPAALGFVASPDEDPCFHFLNPFETPQIDRYVIDEAVLERTFRAKIGLESLV